ncbi:50S ribosomal protein LX [Acidilobus saccharovorans 345-15]|uniref:Large ribosomal subunit protein eL20 n=1 Tax=Acidilobus saccharovorans (strain DSM 16705 / JCM 18335 / VKM B-2471 / 345-15) TaxID=666510 RepID=D9Q2H8_ACIS3|nr:50S ribosomal protein L18Ae [Acidilobus saccharovorans]ADL19516.1 50S ribosomal protein LX [Acidilobus saccharovorans 345-15]
MSSDTRPKVYLVEGQMMLSHDKFPEWHKFKVFVRSVKERDALERVYSELGSRHKLKRYHIRILSVKEIPLEQVTDAHILSLAEATRVK